MIEKISVKLSVLQGKGLAPKDRNLFTRAKNSSDPYVKAFTSNDKRKAVGRTKTKQKTLNPVWNHTFANLEFPVPRSSAITAPPGACSVTLKIYDEDLMSDDDCMGIVCIPIPSAQKTDTDTTAWYDVPPDSAKGATGKLQLRLQITIIRSQSLVRGNAFGLSNLMEHKFQTIQVGLAWDMIGGNQHVDLDVSCVAVTNSGQISMADTVYYGNICNSNRSVYHSGDEQEGDEVGDDETLFLELNRVPPYVLAMYIVLTVATPNMKVQDIQSTTVRVIDPSQQRTLCSFTPADEIYTQDSTAIFMLRIARSVEQQWVVSPIQDTHPTARDFGGLVPYFKSYTRDLLPSIVVDPLERVAILRKGGNIRLTDYTHGDDVPNVITLGLAWDITNGVNIDLDASVICLDRDLNLVDKVFFGQLRSKDGAIQHHGDEREGDNKGDDEKIDLRLSQINPQIQYVGFAINSYSGQELDDVSRASCHLFDPKTSTDICSYAISNASALDGYTALVLGCFYRVGSNEWCFCIISEAAQGRTVKDNVDELQNYIRRSPPQPPVKVEIEDEEIVLGSQMPAYAPMVEEEIDMGSAYVPQVNEEEIDMGSAYVPGSAYDPKANEEEVDLSAPLR